MDSNRQILFDELNFLAPRLQDAAGWLNHLSQQSEISKRSQRVVFHRLEEISDDLNFISRYLRKLSAYQQNRNKYNPVKRNRIPELGNIPSRTEVVMHRPEYRK